MNNIILIGMPGAGKSTIGVLLAKALGMDFVDTDIIIQQRTGRLLQDIIDNDGIEPFLQIEEDVLSSLELKNSIIATGGSAVYSHKAMTALKQTGRAVYISLPYDEIEKRITNITTRGIVLRSGNTLQDAFNERVPLYKKYADITVDCSGKDIESSMRELVAKL
ncbi:MAG: shikimate kinase [Oscillospiraceae bacterium]|nr:shikimate kinase [Oscillospiraceae bacterium]